MVLDQAEPRHLWVGVEVGGILETADGGATWGITEVAGNPDIHGLVRDPAQPDVFYATTGFGRLGAGGLPETECRAGVYRSDDGGHTWQYAWGDLERRYTRPICIDPRAPHALTVGCAPSFRSNWRDEGGAGSMVYQSVDGGRSWRSLGDTAHSPCTANVMAVAPATEQSGSVIVGMDSGEVWHVSSQATWSPLADSLPSVQALLALG